METHYLSRSMSYKWYIFHNYVSHSQRVIPIIYIYISLIKSYKSPFYPLNPYVNLPDSCFLAGSSSSSLRALHWTLSAGEESDLRDPGGRAVDVAAMANLRSIDRGFMICMIYVDVIYVVCIIYVVDMVYIYICIYLCI